MSNDLLAFISRIPDSLGYELTDDHVLLIGAGRTDDRPTTMDLGPIAALRWSTLESSPHPIGTVIDAAAIHPLRSSGVNGFLVVGYGPAGKDRAAQLEQIVVATGAGCYGTLAVDTDHATIEFLDGDTWRGPLPLSTNRFDAVLQGLPPAAKTEAEYIEQFTPLPSPSFSALSAAAAAEFDKHRPSERLQLALAAVDTITQDRGGPLDPDAAGTLARAVTGSSKAVRDQLLVSSQYEPEIVSALATVYRAAPPELRGPIAPVAAYAQWMGAKRTGPAHTILSGEKDWGPNHSLGQVLRECLDQALPPHSLPADMAFNALDAEDQAFTFHSRISAGFPSRPTTQRPNGPAGPHRPLDPGKPGPELDR